LLNVLNGSNAGVLAQVNAQGTGIDIRSRLSGADFQIGENGGTTATQLGVRSLNVNTALADLNQGLGVETANGTDFVIRRNDGVELSLDISSAKTIGDVLNLINNHPDNLDPASRVVAKLKDVGNGIELVDDNPVGSGTLTVIRSFESTAAWDLGLVPRGSDQVGSGDGPPATAATTTVIFSPPDDQNNRFTITANQVGTALNGVQVEFINSAASGDQAFVSFDPVTKKLTIDVDPAATTANTVIGAINLDGTFSAALDLSTEPTNDGSGLVTQTGTLATLAGGTPHPTAQSAAALVTFAPPNDVNTALLVTANQAGTSLNGVTIEFEDTLVGDVASVNFDSINKRLVVSIDAAQTTAATIAGAIAGEGTFFAQLDTTTDPTNDGSGVVGTVGVVATTQGGTAETIGGADVNPLEVHSTFNSLLRLIDALEDFDLVEIERAIALIDEDLDRVNFTRAELGAAARGLDTLQVRLEDENVELRQALSNEIDVDLVDAISRLTTQQAAFQASLQMIGQTFQLTLLDFL
jgi:flagellin-like hook-associated protein FlgL